MTDSDSVASPNDGENTTHLLGTISMLIEKLTRHVVQVEVLILALMLFQVLLSLQPVLQPLLGSSVTFLLPFAFLALMPLFVRVTNPESSLRSRLTFGLSGAGFGGMLGGALAGALHGSIGGPVGALIGASIGLVVGTSSGPFIEAPKKVLTQGEAREWLIKKRSEDLDIKEIIVATEHPPVRHECTIYMFPVDGVIKCTKQDMLVWLNSGCWRHSHRITTSVENK